MEDIWAIFCGSSGCFSNNGKPCSVNWMSVAQPSSCINHALIICFDVILLLFFLLTLFSKSNNCSRFTRFSCLQLTSAIFNGLLGILYLSLFIWVFEDQVKKTHSALPLHWWLVILFHGITWLSISLTMSLRGKLISRTPLRLLSILVFVFAGISLVAAIVYKEVTMKIALDVSSFVGACLLLLCTYKGLQHEERDENGLYAPLNGAANGISENDAVGSVTPFAKAGILNKMSFWWLNPLMKRGKQKTLEDKI